MSPNDISFNKAFIPSSTETSDSESLLEEDLKRGGNHISKQWEAIERTLYQEPGQQVTDPELLKECKLWRETFPHIRVKGTKIDLNQTDDKLDETEKSIQTINGNFDLKKLEQKRETIKKRVVGELVGRLIAKYGFEKDESLEVEKNNGVQITEIDDENSEKLPSPRNNISKVLKKNSPVVSPVRESYFERGKPKSQEPQLEDEGVSIEQMEKNLYDIFNSWEEECKTAKLPNSCDSNRQNLTKSSQPSSSLWYKPKNFYPPPDSLSNVEKPYEIKNVIDKKYEGLIQSIMDRKLNDLNPTRHCRSSASRLEIKSYQESLEKLRKESGFNDFLRKTEMPKLNNFNNNWLKRSENNFRMVDNIVKQKIETVKPAIKKSPTLRREEDKFLEDLKLSVNYKKPVKKNGFVDGLQRPRPFIPVTVKSFKSSSCGDLPKKNKKEVKPRQLQSGLEMGKSESNFKNRIRSNKLNNSKGSKSNGNQNPLLPPIESGIICKEIKTMTSKNISRRY